MNRRLVFCKLHFIPRTTSCAVLSEVKCLKALNFLFSTADVLLALWPHVRFAKCGITLKKCRHRHRRKKKVSLPHKILNTNNSNESVHFYHSSSKIGLGLSSWMLNPDKHQHQQLSTARCFARYVKKCQKWTEVFKKYSLFKVKCIKSNVEQ